MNHSRKSIFKHSFGGKIQYISAVQTICSVTPTVQCEVCSKVPIGDYYQNFVLGQALCRPCMQNEITYAKFHSKSNVLTHLRLKVLHQYRVGLSYIKGVLTINITFYRGFAIVTSIMIIRGQRPVLNY